MEKKQKQKKQPPGRSRWRQLVSDIFVIQTTFSGGRASATGAFTHFECVTRAANARCGRCFKESFTLHLHSRSAPAHLQSARMEATPRDALKCVGREKPTDYNIYPGNRSRIQILICTKLNTNGYCSVCEVSNLNPICGLCRINQG